MMLAFVLINAEIGKEREVLKELRSMEGIKEANVVYGVYDLIAKVETGNKERLKEVVAWKIHNLNDVVSTLPIIVTKSV